MILRSAVAATSLAVALAGSTILTAPSSAADSSNDVRVATYNLTGVNTDTSASGDHRVWSVRRPSVVNQILYHNLDVVGIQEANQSTVYKSRLYFGVNQYLDLLGALRHRGKNWAITNDAMYNCVRSTSANNCDYQDRGASNDTRIIYNADRLDVEQQGAVRYATQTAGKNVRYLVWAVFRVKDTGHEFFFATTHLDPYSADVRQGQWRELISDVNSLHGDLPVVVTGDFNTSKFSSYAATYLPAMRDAGYGDVMNQEPSRPKTPYPRAETTTNAWVNSFNGYRRKVAGYSDDKANKVGNGIDWIFASNSLPVKNWAVTLNMNPSTLQLRGVIPSDHFMVRAVLTI